MSHRIKLLFVCTSNMLCHPTAENMYKNDMRFEVLSCGTDKDARVRINCLLCEWADKIICFEKEHEKVIKTYHDYNNDIVPIINLNIEDNYDYMQPELIELIKERMSHIDFNIES